MASHREDVEYKDGGSLKRWYNKRICLAWTYSYFSTKQGRRRIS